MTIVPKPFWPLAEHIAFGQNAFDGSIGSGVIFCIKHILPGALDFFNSLPFHRLLGSYPSPGHAANPGEPLLADVPSGTAPGSSHRPASGHRPRTHRYRPGALR